MICCKVLGTIRVFDAEGEELVPPSRQRLPGLALVTNVCSSQDVVYWSILNELYPNATLDDFLTSLGI